MNNHRNMIAWYAFKDKITNQLIKRIEGQGKLACFLGLRGPVSLSSNPLQRKGVGRRSMHYTPGEGMRRHLRNR